MADSIRLVATAINPYCMHIWVFSVLVDYILHIRDYRLDLTPSLRIDTGAIQIEIRPT